MNAEKSFLPLRYQMCVYVDEDIQIDLIYMKKYHNNFPLLVLVLMSA